MSFKVVDQQNVPLLLGLAGKAGSGKSTVAAYLCREHGYQEFAFAAALKEVVGVAFDFSQEQLYGDQKETVDPRWGVSPRWCLQWLGTEVLRARFPEIWIKHLRRDMLEFLSINGQRPVVVSDVRFADEALALKKMGGMLVKIERTGGGAALGNPAHSSETALDDYEGFDYLLLNNGTLEWLLAQVDNMVVALGGGRQIA